MKKIYLCLLACVMAFAACSTPEKQAKKLIKEYLKNNLHDYDSYECVKFGTLDSVFTKLLDDSTFTNVFAKRLAHQKLRNNMFDKAEQWKDIKKLYDFYLENEKLQQDTVQYYYNIEDSIKNNFTPKFNGFAMQHSFRANNANGNKILTHKVYIFNKELTEIVNSEDWETYYNYDIEKELDAIKKRFLELE